MMLLLSMLTDWAGCLPVPRGRSQSSSCSRAGSPPGRGGCSGGRSCGARPRPTVWRGSLAVMKASSLSSSSDATNRMVRSLTALKYDSSTSGAGMARLRNPSRSPGSGAVTGWPNRSCQPSAAHRSASNPSAPQAVAVTRLSSWRPMCQRMKPMLLAVGAGRHSTCSAVSPSQVACSRRCVCARQSAMNWTVFISGCLYLQSCSAVEGDYRPGRPVRQKLPVVVRNLTNGRGCVVVNSSSCSQFADNMSASISTRRQFAAPVKKYDPYIVVGIAWRSSPFVSSSSCRKTVPASLPSGCRQPIYVRLRPAIPSSLK